MSRIESYVLHIGLDLIHFRTMIWVYALYLLWNFVSLKESFLQENPFLVTRVYLDAVDIAMVSLAVAFAMRGRLWLEDSRLSCCPSMASGSRSSGSSSIW